MSIDVLSRARRWLMPVGAALSIGCAGLYTLLPFSYAYFQNTPYFRYPRGDIGKSMQRTRLAALYERAWAITPVEPFVEGDITCQFFPALTTSGCVRPLQSGFYAYGPSKPMPQGKYRATVELKGAEGCSGALRVDVISTDFEVILAETQATVSSGSRTVQIDFPLDSVLADRAKVDVRVIQISGPSCVVLERVHLIRRFL